MKKNILATLTLVSPLLLSSCQTVNDVFGEPGNRGHQGYQNYNVYGEPVRPPHHGNAVQTDGSASHATKVRTYQPKTTSSSVPVEAPTVHGASATTDSGNGSASAAPNNVPTAPAVVPASAPAMAAPAVGE